MLEKLAGYKTEIRILEKKLKEMDHAKLSPAKVKEVTEAIKNLKDLVKEKEDKRIERKKKKDEAAASKPAEAPKVEAAPQTPEVVKESLTTPTEVTKESDTTHFAVDAKVEPSRGTPGSWGTVIRSSGTNGDPLCYVKWAEGPLKAREEYGAYYESDLKMKVEKEAVNTDYVPREKLYDLEADLRGNYQQMIKDLEEEYKTALDKGEAVWAHRIEQKLNDAKQAYKDRFEKTAEDENGSGGTEKLKVVDFTPAHDKDPQEKSTGYGGDRSMGALTAPQRDDMTSLNASLKTAEKCPKHKCEMPDGICEECLKAEDTAHFKEHGKYPEASLKFADLDLDSIEKRWALYVDGKLAIRTLTRSKAERIAQERFPEQVAAGKYEIKREDHIPVTASKKEAAEFSGHGLEHGLNDLYVLPSSPEEAQKIEEYLKQNGRSYQWSLSNVEGQPWHGKRFIEIPFGEGLKGEIEKLVGGKVEASLVKRAINITIAEKLFVVNPLGKTAEDEYGYSVSLANGNKLFKITSKDEMGQEHLAYVIEKEILNHKEASNKCAICNQEFSSWVEYDAHEKEKHSSKPSIAKLTSNLAFLKKGSFVSILDVDKVKKQVKFASLDNSLRGWAPSSKFSAFGDIDQKFMDHEGHKDEVFAESGNELLVSCPAGSTNITWRAIEAPPATPESLNMEEGQDPSKISPQPGMGYNDGMDQVVPLGSPLDDTHGKEVPEKKAAGCDQCEATMINGVFCHETGCPNGRKRENPIYDVEDTEITGSLNKDAHIRHEDGKWVIYSHDYKKKLGTYDSKEAAEKRLREIEYFKHQGSLKPLSKKEANVMETKCEECGEPLGPEAFLSKWNVCGKCTKKRHEKAVGKRADQEVSLADQVQSFRDRMQAVNDRLATPPAKTADLETTQDLSKVDIKDLSEGILHMIDLLESKVGENVSADPELHPMLEELENKVYEIEMKLGIKPELPEHEKEEPEHAEVVKQVEEKKEDVPVEASVEVKSDAVNTPPTTLPPAGFKYAWDPKNNQWILVQIEGATGGGY